MLGAVLVQMGRLDESLAPMELAARLAPNDAEAHDNLGAVQLQLGQVTEAVASHEKAIALQPSNAGSYCSLGNAFRTQGQHQAAEENFKKSISLAPDNAGAYHNLASMLQDLGRLEQAENLYTKAIELAPENAMSALGRWEVRFDKGDFENALKDAESFDTEDLRACALETLFALGRNDEVQSRLVEQGAKDSRNLRIAAFSSFFSAQTKRKVPNHFCEDPLECIYLTNISHHIKRPAEFISELIEELSNFRVIWEPSGKSTKGGFQTPESTNLFKEPSGSIRKLNDLVRLEIENYTKSFKHKAFGFIRDWPSETDLSAWCVSLQQQGFQKPHIHPEGWLSGVIYLKVSPSRESDEGAVGRRGGGFQPGVEDRNFQIGEAKPVIVRRVAGPGHHDNHGIGAGKTGRHRLAQRSGRKQRAGTPARGTVHHDDGAVLCQGGVLVSVIHHDHVGA